MQSIYILAECSSAKSSTIRANEVSMQMYASILMHRLLIMTSVGVFDGGEVVQIVAVLALNFALPPTKKGRGSAY